eukprot:TRINITY_DN17814_c0_g1_i1.p1 TRINITY_DN17814_c0_g1~~TRINITY_DN17814_c0_g1_i1.p1  ORF type:complete len:294 (+),score=53.07 TRINITY_DN17814_c0_g1_i1:242-1123(+)
MGGGAAANHPEGVVMETSALETSSESSSIDVAAEAPPTRCWTHPFIWPPAAAVLTIFAAAVLSRITGAAGICHAFMLAAVLATIGYFTFLVVLLAMGHPLCREEGPSSATGLPASAFHADLLKVQDGVIGMSMSPGRKRGRSQRNLGQDLLRVRNEYEFDVVVTLLEDRELQVMKCEDMGEKLKEMGMSWLHFPIRDKWIPSDSRKFMTEAVLPVVAMLAQGKRVLVHCNGGKGRTGTLVAAVLLTGRDSRLKVDGLSQAVRVMRGSRPGMLKNPLQQMYLMHLLPALRQLCS